ncbi:MAG TPA: hypothetical protein VJT32_07405 [bacterium]|nr:hypothetical protein [bacterium]
MKVTRKKVAMIMLMGLLIAGPLASLHHASAQNSPAEGANTALKAAQASEDKAAQMYTQMMMSMDSMKKMPMTGNEKSMMKMMNDMAATIKLLMDSNKQLIEALHNIMMMPANQNK